jgi:hypothetical protein
MNRGNSKDSGSQPSPKLWPTLLMEYNVKPLQEDYGK